MNLIRDFKEGINGDEVFENLVKLFRIERKQTFPAYEDAAMFVYNLAKEAGFEPELMEFPADGKTVYQDKICPLAWDMTEGRLELLTNIPGVSDPVLCDYKREPLSVAKFSTATPKEGIKTRLVTENQMKTGMDVEGALVLLNPSTRPYTGIIKAILDLGALGWVSDFQEEGLNEDIDAVYWCNAATEFGAWVGIAGERDYIGYQVSPRCAYYLRSAAEQGAVELRAYSDGHRYEGIQYAVSTFLPGEEDKEVWILSHLYEPLIDDNCNGTIGSLEILKMLKKFSDEGKIKLKYGVRYIAASEVYGMAAVIEKFGGYLGDKCLGAVNTDGMKCLFERPEHRHMIATEAADMPGFVGNIFLHEICDRIQEEYPDFEIVHWDHRHTDDTCVSDTTVGLPTIWLRGKKDTHHHSTQDETKVNMETFRKFFAANAEWVRAMAATTEDEVREILPKALRRANEAMEAAAKTPIRKGMDAEAMLKFILNREQEKIRGLKFYADIPEVEETCAKIIVPKPQNEVKEVDDLWFNYAEHFVFTRLTRGFPHNQANLPTEERKRLPGGVIYSRFSDALSRMDGKKNFKEILTEIEWDIGEFLSDAEIKTYIQANFRLVKGKYISMEADCILTSKMLSDAIAELGVEKGETVLVHSSISSLGCFENSTATVIEALRDAVGEEGTFLAPAFARPYIAFEGSVNKNLIYRPYDTRENGALRDKTINTGALPIAMLKEKDSFRSGHISHEWVAIGKNAEKCVSEHKLLDAPAGKTSPMDKALELDGSVIFLGCSVGANTFIHYIEDMADVPFLGAAVVKYIDRDGLTYTDVIKRHLPGCRSFYQGFDGYFYQEAIRRGLHIDEVSFGIGKLYRIKLRDLYEIGMEMHKEDPMKLLCGKEGCAFCNRYKKK